MNVSFIGTLYISSVINSMKICIKLIKFNILIFIKEYFFFKYINMKNNN